MVVVHGYNTSWMWAAREAAQLALDLEASGTPVVPVLFSWPSGGLVRYCRTRTRHTARSSVSSRSSRVVSAAVHELWGRYLTSLLDAGQRTTLYVSPRDRALLLSRALHGGYPRLGLHGFVDPPGEVEIIDTATLDRGYTRHSTFRQSEVALRDLAGVLAGTPPTERALLVEGGRWTFEK